MKKAENNLFTQEEVEVICNVINEYYFQKIFITGCVGSGKTVFAKKLSRKTGFTHIELDQYFQKYKDETGKPARNIKEILNFALDKNSSPFIIEHAELLETDMGFADAVILINSPLSALINAIKRRKRLRAKGDWIKFSPKEIEKMAKSLYDKFNELSGKIIYINTRKSLIIKKMRNIE